MKAELHIPRIRRLFGLRWNDSRMPSRWIESGFIAMVVIALWVAVMEVVADGEQQKMEAANAIHKAHIAEMEKAHVEASLVHLLNGGVLIADTDFISCKLKDRASTRM